MQGYLFSRPLTVEQADVLLKTTTEELPGE
jgi:EAL domain-containing protein (putative c-di-GMP-specific phosphodiesterase class I)